MIDEHVNILLEKLKQW